MTRLPRNLEQRAIRAAMREGLETFRVMVRYDDDGATVQIVAGRPAPEKREEEIRL